MFALGFTLYGINIAVGLTAQLSKKRFGVWHHALYAAVFASAIAAAAFDFRPGLVVTLCALAVFPFAKPRTPWHPTLAVVGLGGYVHAALAV